MRPSSRDVEIDRGSLNLTMSLDRGEFLWLSPGFFDIYRYKN